MTASTSRSRQRWPRLPRHRCEPTVGSGGRLGFQRCRVAGERVYAHGGAPVDTYPNLKAGLDRQSLQTVTVGTSVCLAKRWAERHLQGYRLLLNPVSQNRSELLKPLVVQRTLGPLAR